MLRIQPIVIGLKLLANKDENTLLYFQSVQQGRKPKRFQLSLLANYEHLPRPCKLPAVCAPAVDDSDSPIPQLTELIKLFDLFIYLSLPGVLEYHITTHSLII